MKKDFFDWFVKKEKTFTAEAVKELVERIKVFNAGAIDEHLTKHVDKVLQEWLKEQKGA